LQLIRSHKSSLQLEDWYKISRKDLVAKGGRKLFTEYKSLEQALRTIYPSFAWRALKFAAGKTKVRKGFWDDVSNQREFFDDLGEQLNLSEVNISIIFCNYKQ